MRCSQACETKRQAERRHCESEVPARYERRLRAAPTQAKPRRHDEEIAIPSIVRHELPYGVERLPASRKRDVIERYLEEVVVPSMPILVHDREAAEWHAAERARLTAQGETPAFVDGQIAAIAHVHDLTVLTFNVGDFRRFGGLAAVSW